ncbi:hypothetical protein CLF_110003 [Clonorchis sinensis]|uniref:Uncharacterized protein n=1 Tax=Clonorchis sinensis TaxID=79923 RepID=G7YK40_CLOSI|nr:hypothetical protein CLF_110003 [Clonorchis sinensis]
MPEKKTQRREHNRYIPNKRVRGAATRRILRGRCLTLSSADSRCLGLIEGCEALYIEGALSGWSTPSRAEGLSRSRAFSSCFQESDLPDNISSIGCVDCCRSILIIRCTNNPLRRERNRKAIQGGYKNSLRHDDQSDKFMGAKILFKSYERSNQNTCAIKRLLGFSVVMRYRFGLIQTPMKLSSVRLRNIKVREPIVRTKNRNSTPQRELRALAIGFESTPMCCGAMPDNNWWKMVTHKTICGQKLIQNAKIQMRPTCVGGVVVTRSPRMLDVRGSNPDTATGQALLMSSNKSETRVQCFPLMWTHRNNYARTGGRPFKREWCEYEPMELHRFISKTDIGWLNGQFWFLTYSLCPATGDAPAVNDFTLRVSHHKREIQLGSRVSASVTDSADHMEIELLHVTLTVLSQVFSYALRRKRHARHGVGTKVSLVILALLLRSRCPHRVWYRR